MDVLPTQVQPDSELEHHQADGAVAALPKGVPEDDSGNPRVQAVIHLQPQADQQPGKHAKAQEQNFGGKVKKKHVLQPQPDPCLISRPKA